MYCVRWDFGKNYIWYSGVNLQTQNFFTATENTGKNNFHEISNDLWKLLYLTPFSKTRNQVILFQDNLGEEIKRLVLYDNYSLNIFIHKMDFTNYSVNAL